MKKVILTLAIVFAACCANAQAPTQPKDTTKKEQVPAKQDKLTEIISQAYQKFGEETGKYLTKAQWDQTMAILSDYLRAAIEAYKKEEVPKK